MHGGNVTGLANFAEMLAAKQIDLLREMLPHLARFGLLVDVTNQLHVPQLRETKMAAEALGILLVPARLADPTSLIWRSQRWARSALKVCSSLLIQLFIRGVGKLPTLQQRHVCRRFTVIASMSKLADS